MWPFKPDIGRLERRGDVHRLVRALRFKRDPQVRASAAEALGKLQAQTAGPALAEALQDSGTVMWDVIGAVPVRAEVAKAFSHIRYAPAIPALMDLLRDEDVRVRRNAATALGFQGDRRATIPLTALLNDPRPAVRESAVLALEKLGDPDAVQALLALVGTHAGVRSDEA